MSVAECVILFSTCLKVTPGVSRMYEYSFVGDVLREQLWGVLGWLSCWCTEQTTGRREADAQRSG